jgi:hypothetical protein
MATLRTLQPLGTGVLRYGLVFLLLFWGGLKFAAFEAAAIQPLLAHSPFLAWMLVVFDGTGGRPRPSSASSRSSSPSGSWRVASARLRSGQSRRERHVPGHAELS